MRDETHRSDPGQERSAIRADDPAKEDGSKTTGESRRLKVLGPGIAVVLLLTVLAVVLARKGSEKTGDHGFEADTTTAKVLHREIERALRRLQAPELRDVSGEGGAALEDVRLALLRLRDFDLPLLVVRHSALRARDQIRSGEGKRAAETLFGAEELLVELGEKGYPGLSRELQPLLDLLVETRAEAGAGRPGAASDAERLASRVELLLLRGDLALHSTRLDAP